MQITGRYASRSAYGRQRADDEGKKKPKVTIPWTKLADLEAEGYTNDCTEDNMAVVLKNAGYRTGMIGKWHLTPTDSNYTYAAKVDEVKGCGFDYAGAVYAENLYDENIQEVDSGTGYGTDFSHNMEWVTAEGIDFINCDYDDCDDSEPFMMYFNPTVPHSSGDVRSALEDFTCTDIADLDDPLIAEPEIEGMTEGIGCEAYREGVISRAGGASASNIDLGAVWLDDSVGALITALENKGILNSTLILFQVSSGISESFE